MAQQIVPIANYQVVLKDQSGNKVAIFDDWWHLSMYKRINTPSSAHFRINGLDSRVSLFEIDGQIEVWRRVNGYTDWYLEYEGLIRKFARTTDEEGERVFGISTLGYIDLVDRRIISYKAGHAKSGKDTAAETAMKEFVEENCGASATVANGRILEGEITGLSIQADGAFGDNWTGKRAYKNLLGVLQEIATSNELDFNVIGIGNALYEFRTYENQRGDNRSRVNLGTRGLNPSGNSPVVFSLVAGNMKVPNYEEDRISEKNTALIMGQGTEDEREVVVEKDQDAIDVSPINQRETTRDARQQTETDELESIGINAIDERGAVENFSFGTIQAKSTIYGVHYFAGDIVTADYDTITRHKKIVGVDIVVDSPKTAEDINLVIGDRYGY